MDHSRATCPNTCTHTIKKLLLTFSFDKQAYLTVGNKLPQMGSKQARKGMKSSGMLRKEKINSFGYNF